MIQVRFFAWGKIPRFVCCIFCNCMFCLLISNWMNSEGGLLVLWIVTGFLFLRVRTRYRKGQYWWWELKSSSDSLRIQFPPFFSFAQVRYTQSYTYFCLYVWQNGRGCTLVSAGIECAGTKDVQGQRFQCPFWVSTRGNLNCFTQVVPWGWDYLDCRRR